MSVAFEHVREATWQGQPALTLRDAGGATATLSLHGAHLLSWRGPDDVERLYLSPTSRFGPGQAVRGGVPVIFPRFAQRGPESTVPRHGFARNRAWERVELPAGGEGAAVALQLASDASTRALWPHDFELQFTLRLDGAGLSMRLDCRNTGDTAFDFSAALHSYFAVERLTATTLHGLQGSHWLDTTDGREHVENEAVIAFDGREIDRIHWSGGLAPLTLSQGARRMRLEADGLPDVVVWNPGAAKAAQLDDLPPGDESRFVCVEAGAIDPRIALAPGESWRGEQRLTALA